MHGRARWTDNVARGLEPLVFVSPMYICYITTIQQSFVASIMEGSNLAFAMRPLSFVKYTNGIVQYYLQY